MWGVRCQHCLGRVIGHSRRGEKQALSASPEPAGDLGRGSGPTLKHGLCRFRTSAEESGRRFTAAEAPALRWGWEQGHVLRMRSLGWNAVLRRPVLSSFTCIAGPSPSSALTRATRPQTSCSDLSVTRAAWLAAGARAPSCRGGSGRPVLPDPPEPPSPSRRAGAEAAFQAGFTSCMSRRS